MIISGQYFANEMIRHCVAEVVRNVELKAITKAEDIAIVTDLILRNANAFRVKFIPRLK